MKKLFSLLMAIAMLFTLCVTAFADSPIEASHEAEPLASETVQPRSAEHTFQYDLGVGESAEYSDFYGYYTAGTEIDASVRCTSGSKVTIHFWSDSGSACSTVAYNGTDGAVVLPSSGFWHVEVIANYNKASKGTLWLVVDP